nr:MAG TPA: hypothetical protein [Caudoviricetes sp.]
MGCCQPHLSTRLSQGHQVRRGIVSSRFLYKNTELQ